MTENRNRNRTAGDRGRLTAEWLTWLLFDGSERPKRAAPPAVRDVLAALPSNRLDPIIKRLAVGIHELSEAEPRTSKPVFNAWLTLIKQTIERRYETQLEGHATDFVPELVTAVIALVNRVLQGTRNPSSSSVFGRPPVSEAFELLNLMGSENPRDRRLVAVALASGTVNAERVTVDVIRHLGAIWPTSSYVPFLKDLSTEVVKKGGTSDLARVVQLAAPQDQKEIVMHLAGLARANQLPTGPIADLVFGRTTGDSQPRLSLPFAVLLEIALLVQDPDVDGGTASNISEVLSKAFSDEPMDGLGGTLSIFASNLERRAESRMTEMLNQAEAGRRGTETELDGTRESLGRTMAQVNALEHELQRGRDLSAFDLRRDILLAIGETLQFVDGSENPPDHVLADARAGLLLALGAGEAETYATRGETIPYDPSTHDSANPVAMGASVVVIAPGIRLQSAEAPILLKARVKPA